MGRRRFLVGALAGSAPLFTVPGAFAELLVRTPPQTEGPFYPDKLPLDRDNDLIVVGDSLTPAVGEITQLHGRVTDVKGAAVVGALVEIWQVDNNGAYLHSRDPRVGLRDGNFQGYGKFETGGDGGYRFRTIKPVPYPGRAPHIHMAVSVKGERVLTTQCYVSGHEGNARDGILQRIGNEAARASVLVDFAPVEGSEIGELSARFDVVLGLTPGE